jgi:MFS family permease
MFGVFSLLLQEALGYTVAQNYYFFAGFAVSSVLLQAFVVGPVSDRLGDRRTSNIGLMFALASFLVVPFVHSFWTAELMIIPFAAGMALARPCLTSLITDATPQDQRGVILGTGSALDNLSGVIMPPISTGLLGRYGSTATGLPSTLFSLIALVMGLYAQRRARKVEAETTAAEPVTSSA